MKTRFVILATLLLLCPPAFAWNDKAHSTVGNLAYQALSPAQREAVLQILKKHPHYSEYLSADRPDNVPEPQWVFWRAATWADWVRNHHSAEYSHPTWHYVDYPFIPPGSHESAANHQPSNVNAVTQLAAAIEKAKSGTEQEKAVNLCWVFHLIGDLHQPMHCVSLYCEQFPEGDRGGNLARYRLASGRVLKLHSFWDGLLGKSTSLASVGGSSQEAKETAEDDAEVRQALETSKSPEAWSKETFAVAVKYGYLDGRVLPANSDDHPSTEDIPRVADKYAADAGRIARLATFKAGNRLAETVKDVVH